MKQWQKTLQLNRRLILTILVLAVITVGLELLVCNITSLRTAGLTPVSLTGEADDIEVIGGEDYRTEIVTVGDYVKNIHVDLDTEECNYAEVTITLTDEGNRCSYDMPSIEVMPQVEATTYSNIYPYDRVNTIYVTVHVPEGAKAYIHNISLNVPRPVDMKPLRMLIIFGILSVLYYAWSYGNRQNQSNESNKAKTYVRIATIAITMIILLIAGRWLTRCNDMIVQCPWPHHTQYQQLAHSLDQGTVRLDLPVDEGLLTTDNPYDTIGLIADGIEYNMDYAYYDGSYYVYFGIMPELLLYYPYYKVTGQDLTNYNAMFILYAFMEIGVFLGLYELMIRLRRRRNIDIPFPVYIMLAVGITLFSNNVYMTSRADIYNIPIMMATGATYMGLALWLMGTNIHSKGGRIATLAAGSLCMALVAGCRPQLMMYSLLAIPIFLIPEKTEVKSGIRHRIGEMLAVCIPYILIAGIVCWYNQARFGNILDFGASYSLTTNDMNHRGFNLNRLLRGLYSDYIQPAVLGLDFPYIRSSIVESNYMGRGIVEFTYGGTLVTNLMTLAVLAPLFGLWRKLELKTRVAYILLLLSSLIIACFDVNGAGIIYRYTCDMVPGLIMAAVLIWMSLMNTHDYTCRLAVRLYSVCFITGLFYSLLVLLGPAGSPTLQGDSQYVYELIHSYFSF